MQNMRHMQVQITINNKMKTKTGKISKEMTFAEVIAKHPETMPVFLEHGMACFGCPMAANETIGQGAIAHGINVDKLIKKLNEAIKSKKK